MILLYLSILSLNTNDSIVSLNTNDSIVSINTNDSVGSLNTNDSITDCTGVCPTVYPCLLINVSLNAGDGESWTVALYSDDY